MGRCRRRGGEVVYDLEYCVGSGKRGWIMNGFLDGSLDGD